MRSLFRLLPPAVLCAAFIGIAAAPHVTLASAEQGRARGRQTAPPPTAAERRTEFRQRHEAEGAVPALKGSLKILARMPWTDTRITVRPGQRVSFEAIGSVFFSLDEGAIAGPNGIDNGRANRRTFPVRDLGVCGLIGHVGNDAPFSIGSDASPIVMSSGGRLYLGVNDSEFADNSGFFRVKVRIQ
jgi:hypothetical protein